MPDLFFDLPPRPSIAVTGTETRYPVGRIFCVGRNYAAHAAEMGNEVDREAPFYFTKGLGAVCESGAQIPYPPGTRDYHHEIELAVAIGAPAFKISPEDAGGAIFGYGVALDMTRRDLQSAAKEKRRPWSLGKDVEGSAVLASFTRAAQFGAIADQRIHLEVNGTPRQEGRLSDLIHSVPEIVADLSRFYHLAPGDIILTGTPAGVGPVVAGDRITGGIDGLAPISLTLTEPA